MVEHEGLIVARDDMFEFGSKARFADFLIKTCPKREIVYGGSPGSGYAQISLAYLAKKYNKMLTLYVPARKWENLTPYQKKAYDMGADIRMIPTYGSMNPCLTAAIEYQKMDGENRFLAPFGLNHPTVIASIIRVGRSLNINPRRVFCVGSSGALAMGLQLAFPNAEMYVMQVGRKIKQQNIGRATVFVYKKPFDQMAEVYPPYPAIRNYDAKIWECAKEMGKPGDLVWNVAKELQ